MTSSSLSTNELNSLFACLCRDRTLFFDARDKIDSECFSETQKGYSAIWTALVQEYAEQDALPSMKALLEVVNTLMVESQTAMQTDYQQAETVINLAASLKIKQYKARREKNRERLQRFLQDRVKRKLVARLTQDSANLYALLTEAQDNLASDDVNADDRFKPALSGFLDPKSNPPLELRETGVSFIDLSTGGGFAPGEVATHIAPIGNGKSSLCWQIAVNRAKKSLLEAGRRDGRPRSVYVFVYEDAAAARVQMYARAAEVSKTSLIEYMKTNNKDVLSSRANGKYKPYELRYLRGPERRLGPNAADGELERIKRAERTLSDVLWLVDFTPTNQANTVMAGNHVDGVADYIREHQRRIGNPGVDFIIIDYVKLVIDLYQDTHNLREDDTRRIYSKFAGRSARKLGGPFKAPVWLAHQLNSKGNEMAPGRLPHMTQAAENKMFHENCMFAFVSGVLTDDRIAAFQMQKQRRVEPAPPYAIKLDGDLVCWSGVSNYSVYNSHIVSREDLDGVGSRRNAAFKRGK